MRLYYDLTVIFHSDGRDRGLVAAITGHEWRSLSRDFNRSRQHFSLLGRTGVKPMKYRRRIFYSAAQRDLMSRETSTDDR